MDNGKDWKRALYNGVRPPAHHTLPILPIFDILPIPILSMLSIPSIVASLKNKEDEEGGNRAPFLLL